MTRAGTTNNDNLCGSPKELAQSPPPPRGLSNKSSGYLRSPRAGCAGSSPSSQEGARLQDSRRTVRLPQNCEAPHSRARCQQEPPAGSDKPRQVRPAGSARSLLRALSSRCRIAAAQNWGLEAGSSPASAPLGACRTLGEHLGSTPSPQGRLRAGRAWARRTSAGGSQPVPKGHFVRSWFQGAQLPGSTAPTPRRTGSFQELFVLLHGDPPSLERGLAGGFPWESEAQFLWRSDGGGGSPECA